jgi:hypothetical protein
MQKKVTIDAVIATAKPGPYVIPLAWTADSWFAASFTHTGIQIGVGLALCRDWIYGKAAQTQYALSAKTKPRREQHAADPPAARLPLSSTPASTHPATAAKKDRYCRGNNQSLDSGDL